MDPVKTTQFQEKLREYMVIHDAARVLTQCGLQPTVSAQHRLGELTDYINSVLDERRYRWEVIRRCAATATRVVRSSTGPGSSRRPGS